jgi:RNA polymerase sigma factor (TIGR02999 family)
MNDATVMLDAIKAGDSKAAEGLLVLVYDELRRLAASKLAHEAPGQTLQPTALVHEAWLRLVGDRTPSFNDREHFFRASAEAMRRILIDRARRKLTMRHGGGCQRVEIEGYEPSAPAVDGQVLALNEALDKFARSIPCKLSWSSYGILRDWRMKRFPKLCEFRFPQSKIIGPFSGLVAERNGKRINRINWAMTPNSGRAIEIFTEALQLPIEERVAFLDRVCAGDEVLRRKIEALLRSNDRAGAFLEEPPTASISEKRGKVAVGEKPGDQVGRYKLLRQIGEGGCGVVFLARIFHEPLEFFGFELADERK